MINLSKTTLLIILLIIFVIISGVFAYQWWQVKGELGKKIEQNERLIKEIDELQKEIEELKAVEGKTEKEVTITTDKTEYEQGEKIEITIRNGLDKAIFGGYCLGAFGLWRIEGFKENKYEEISHRFPIPLLKEGEESCDPIFPEMPLAIKKWEPYFEIHQEWNQKICEDRRVELLEKGNYRLAFTYGLECKLEAYEEPCGCGEIKDPKTIYSNEFIIK